MASGSKRSPQKKKESSDAKEETMETFMSKICARFEKLQVMSRLLEEPEPEPWREKESRRTKSKPKKIYSNVYNFFCDQPSTSGESERTSKKKQQESKPPEGSIQLDSKTEYASSGKVEDNKLETTCDAAPIIELSSRAKSSIFDEQPYIIDPEAPSTSSEFKTVKVDDEILARALEPIGSVNQKEIDRRKSKVTTSGASSGGTTMIHDKNQIKLSPLYDARKKSHRNKHSVNNNADKSVTHKGGHSKRTVKNTKCSQAPEQTIKETKIGLENARAEDIHGRVFSTIDDFLENRVVVNRSQQARERLQRKFDEVQNTPPPKNTKSRGWIT
uniref:Calmodulin-binding domain-containing protein n=1 Tax=Setaria digitata TaxID=48799 RepID=A0A915PIL5_9BILA